MPLSDATLRNLKGREKPYKVSDSGGLHVLVTKAGSRLWRLSYRFAGKQKLLALGAYPDVTLREARMARDNAKSLLEEGDDPGAIRKREKRRARIASGHTFEAVANDWFDAQRARWASGYASRLRSRLDADLIPTLGARPIASIEPIEILDSIRRIEQRDAIEMARRILQMASAIFRFGVATSRCARDPTVDLRGALRPPKEVKHRASLKQRELPEFLKRLEDYDGEETTRLAIRLLIQTCMRTSEVRFARWEQFEGLDGGSPLWRVPAKQMKMKRPHLVPLPTQTVKVLGEIRSRSAKSEFLFPSPTRSGVISENTMLYALYRMGYHGKATVHGFRSTASTILNEAQFNRDWIELQLAHEEGSVRSIYNAAEWLPGRREMLQWWADFLDRQAAHRLINTGSPAG